MVVTNGALNDLRALAGSDDPAKVRRVAREFESMVVGEMLRFASKPIAGGHALDGGSAGRMAREQLHAELARVASHGRGLGLAQQIERQLGAVAETDARPAGRGEEAP